VDMLVDLAADLLVDLAADLQVDLLVDMAAVLAVDMLADLTVVGLVLVADLAVDLAVDMLVGLVLVAGLAVAFPAALAAGLVVDLSCLRRQWVFAVVVQTIQEKVLCGNASGPMAMTNVHLYVWQTVIVSLMIDLQIQE